jgi:hypothetical protein
MITSEIEYDDVKNVSMRIRRPLTEKQVNKVLSLYDGELKQDPTANWSLIVEKIIYDITKK